MSGKAYHPSVLQHGEIAKSLAGLFGEASGRPLSEISLDTPYEALGIGRKGVERIMLGAEWKYNMIIPEEDLERLRTVGQFARYIEAQAPEGG